MVGGGGGTHRHRLTGRQDKSQSGNLVEGASRDQRVESSQLGPESLHLWGLGGASRCMAVGMHVGACARGRGATPGVQWGSTPDRPVVC